MVILLPMVPRPPTMNEAAYALRVDGDLCVSREAVLVLA